MSGSETLLDIAARDLLAAEILYAHKTDDEALLNQVGYFLQQAIELALKHHLELQGIEYPRTHDIDDLLARMPDAARFDYVDAISGSVTALEAKTRYVKNFRASVRTVEKAMRVAKRLVAELREREHLAKKESAQGTQEKASTEH